MGKFVTYASGAIWWPNLELMQVAPSGGQNLNQCFAMQIALQFGTNASGATWQSNFELVQVEPLQLAKF